MIEWQWPWMLALAPLPWLVWRFMPPADDDQAALQVPFYNRWAELSRAGKSNKAATTHVTALAALAVLWLLLLLSAARPIWIGEPVELPNTGRDLMLAVDISGSMRIEDMQVKKNTISRVVAVRQLGAEFISRRVGDRLGLILFGSRAYVQSPLSFDTGTVKRFLLEAQIGFAGQETAIGDAIGLAVKRLRERPASSRVLILLTDGQDTVSQVKPLDAALLAKESGVRIYTVGIGADSLTLPGLFGSSFGSRRVNPSAELDEHTLQQIADLTGGQYFRARNPQDLATIYQELDKMEPVEQEASLYRPRRELGYVPLLAALAISFGLAGVRIGQQNPLGSSRGTGQ